MSRCASCRLEQLRDLDKTMRASAAIRRGGTEYSAAGWAGANQ